MLTATRTAPKQTKPRPKPARSLRLHVAPTALEPGLLQITAGKSSDVYWLTLGDADAQAAGFLLKKLHQDEVYQVTVGANPLNRTCTCPAGKHGRPCKHADGIAKLIEMGLLPGAAGEDDEDTRPDQAAEGWQE